MDNFNPQFQKIGDILVHQKIISAEQLNNALSEQKTTKDKLGNILITQGSITEEELVNAAIRGLGLDYLGQFNANERIIEWALKGGN